MKRIILTVLAAVAITACNSTDLTNPSDSFTKGISATNNSNGQGGNGGQGGSGGQGGQDNGGGVTKLTTPTLSASVDGSSVTFSWNAIELAIEYQIIVDGPTGSSQKVAGTSATFSNLANGSYTAKIRAIAANSEDASQDNSSPFSEWFSFTINVPTPPTDNPPPAPVDVTPPVIVGPSIVGTLGNNGWYTSDVSVSWTVSDPESGISSQSGCTAVLSTDTFSQTFTCTATNGVGLTSSASVTIKRDATPPVVSYSGNAGSYTVDQSINITCSASDALSGIASSTCQNISGDAYLFPLGANSYSATASDNAGNSSSASTSFTVVATYGSTCNLVRRWVTNAGVANSLCVKLTNAAAAEARGNLTAKAGLLGAFANEVRAQTGKFIPADKAVYLLRFVAVL